MKRKRPITPHAPTQTLGLLTVVALVCVGVHYSSLAETWMWQRSALISGQWWRFVTGNLVHQNLFHLLVNMAGLGVFGLVFYRHISAGTLVSLILWLACVVGLVMWWGPYQQYMGLSGVLYGLFMFGGLSTIHTPSGKCIALVTGIKCVADALLGQALPMRAALGIDIAHLAHGGGILGALVFFLPSNSGANVVS
ncbi:rhombosortase [Salinivibrio kushneri]|uniref:Rhombosortase n=1 Tax=Salinivibrio kushneri TaxID=1908198 RepID=A0AB36K227_9GAMM|nr:rhombosortase [Salinivibrio kushneri]OOE41623.1 rhombosortase [Salinivibrio kushneri]QCP02172.1 rhombosortase [Salinivibrio kushneri]